MLYSSFQGRPGRFARLAAPFLCVRQKYIAIRNALCYIEIGQVSAFSVLRCRYLPLEFAGQGAYAVKKRRIILGVLLGVILLLVAGMVFMLAYGVWAYYNTFTSYSLQAILFLNSLPWLISIILLLPVYLVLRRRWKR